MVAPDSDAAGGMPDEPRLAPALAAAQREPQAEPRLGYPQSWLSPPEREAMARRSTAKAFAVILPELAIYAGFVTLALAPLPLPVNLFGSLWAGLFIGVIFTIGHDACHQSLTPSRRLNDWIARLALVPSAHTASLWALGHNRIHHRYTNLKGRDYVWAPMSSSEYRAASRPRRWLYRLYRSPFGSAPYYFVEMWWKKKFLPIAPEARADLPRHLADFALMILGQAALVGGILALGAWLAPDRPAWQILALGWGFPWIVWNWLMGWIIYVHHTHPEVPWFDREADWTYYRAQILGTVHVRLPQPLDFLSNNIMQHNAHHSFPAIPLYNLRVAQEKLRRHFAGVRHVRLTLAAYLAITGACKLFDFERRCWTDFEGNPTGPPLPLAPPAAAA